MSQLTLFGLVPDAPVPTTAKAPKPKHYTPPATPKVTPAAPVISTVTAATLEQLREVIAAHPEREQILLVVLGRTPAAPLLYGVKQFIAKRDALRYGLRTDDGVAEHEVRRTFTEPVFPRLYEAFLQDAAALTEWEAVALRDWFGFEDRCFEAPAGAEPRDNFLLHYPVRYWLAVTA